MALKRKPYYNESARYFNFMFETEEEATAFREVCELLGMTTDKHGYTTDYKTVVYIKNVANGLEN